MPKGVSIVSTTSDRRRWLVLSVTSLGVFMSTLDASIVNIALPKITSFYQAPLASVEWVVMIYLLLMSSLLLTYGRIGDTIGHKRVYVIGFSVFTLGSWLCSIAPSLGFLIGARAIQAIGGGMTMAVVQAVIAGTFPAHERGRAIGINALFVSLGSAIGPTLGGILVARYGWQSIFSINLPIGVLGTLWAWYVLPTRPAVPQRFDLGGAASLFAALSTCLLALSHGHEWGWGSPLVVGLFLVAAVSSYLFMRFEQRVDYPMIRLDLFRNRYFLASNLTALFNYLAQYAVLFLMPFYLQNVLGLASNRAGMLMSVFPLAMMVMGPISGMLSDRGYQSQFLSSMGMGLVGLGIMTLSTLAMTGQGGFIILGLGLAGLGTGLFLAPNNNAIMSSVPKEQLGIGSGMIATMRNLGQVLGIAVTGAVFASRSAHYSRLLAISGNVSPAAQHLIWGQRDAYLVAGAVAFLGMFTSLARGKRAMGNAGTD